NFVANCHAGTPARPLVCARVALSGEIMTDSRYLSRPGNFLLWTAVLAFGAFGEALPVAAQAEVRPSAEPADRDHDHAPDPWRFNAAAYGWLINVSGSVTARGRTVDTNASFIDLVQKSQTVGGLMSYFEADKGKAGMYVDFVYTSLGFGAN